MFTNGIEMVLLKFDQPRRSTVTIILLLNSADIVNAPAKRSSEDDTINEYNTENNAIIK
jgi:hypothetical protein